MRPWSHPGFLLEAIFRPQYSEMGIQIEPRSLAELRRQRFKFKEGKEAKTKAVLAG